MAKLETNLGLSFGWLKGEHDWNTGMDNNLKTLGSVVQLSVASLATNTPPVSIVNGYRTVVGPAPTGVFVGQAGKLAAVVDGTYEFYTIGKGWSFFNEADEKVYVYNGAAFVDLVTEAVSAEAVLRTAADNALDSRLDVLEAASSYYDLPVACSDETTALTAGVGKVTFRAPRAMTLSSVKASLTTAQGSGSIFTVDINKNGVSILSTKITIDNTEKTSTTAATQAVLSSTAIAADDEITIDIDQIGNGTAKGLKVYLIGSIA